MNGYRKPAGHQPYLPESTPDRIGQLSGLCAVVLLCAMLTLSLLALDRRAADLEEAKAIAMEMSR